MGIAAGLLPGLVGLVGLVGERRAGAASAQPPLSVFAGYVVNDGDGPAFVPSPWSGAANTTFVGQATSNNGGAIRIDNSSAAAVTVADVTVDAGTARYSLWGSNLTVPANGSLILSGTTVSTNGSGGNFDLSNTYTCPAPSSLPVPYVTVTVAGIPMSYRDSGQVLNDVARCTSGTEGQAWAPLSASKHGAELWGETNPGWAGAPPLGFANRVNGFTGNLSQTATDLGVGGRGRQLQFTRTYNAFEAALASGPDVLGWGWTDSYAASLSIDASGNVVAHQANGSTVAFYASSGVYTPATAQVTASLVKNGDGTFTLTRTDQTADTFSSSGQLTSLSDRNGYATTLGYTSGRLVSVTEPGGRAFSFGYNAANQLVSVSDSAGRQVAYGYDSAANLVSVTSPAGAITRYGYDSAHRLTSITDARGGQTTTVFDSANRVSAQTDPANRRTTFAYNAATTTVTRPAGNVVAQTYDLNANLTSLTVGQGSPQAATWSYTYDAANNRVGVTDPNSHQTSAVYDAHANIVARTDALGRKTSFAYDGANDVVSLTDPAGATTTFSYNTHFDLTGRSQTVGATQIVASLAYGDPSHPGDVTSLTDPNGRVWRYGYDSVGNRMSITDPAGDQTTFAYDRVGRRTSMVSPRGNASGANPATYTTRYGYDPDGHLVSVTDPMSKTTSAVFDPAGNRTSITDADNHQTRFSYDPANELIQTTSADGSTVTYGYDANGNLSAQTDGLGHATTWSYNPLDRPTSVSDPLGRQVLYSYDGAGNRVSTQDQAGQTATAIFDAANQLTSIAYSDNVTPKVTFGYDLDGRRVSMSDGTGASTFAYDSAGRLTSAVDGAANKVTYGYDLDGRVVTIGYPAGAVTASVNSTSASTGTGTVTRQYDPVGRLSAVTDWLAHTTSFGYDPDGNLTTISRPDTTTATATFDPAGHLGGLVDAGPTVTILNLSYAPDAAGLLSSVSANGGVVGTSQNFGYDPLNRLTGAVAPGPADPATTYGYGFDAGDNLVSLTAAGLSQTVTHDNADQLATITNPSTAQVTTFGFDIRGNRTRMVGAAGTTTTFGYDQASRLTKYTGPPLSIANTQTGTNLIQSTFSYSGDGLLGGITWDRSAAVPAVLAQGGVAYIDGPGGLPIEQIGATGTPVYYHADRAGSTRALTDAAGRVLATFSYDPFGNPTASTSANTVTTPFGFGGLYTDNSGLIFARARFYDPTTAQFLTRNPTVAGAEPYGFGGWSPTNRLDPGGTASALSPLPVFSTPIWQAADGPTVLSAAGPAAALGGLGPNAGSVSAAASAPWCSPSPAGSVIPPPPSAPAQLSSTPACLPIGAGL